MPTPEPEPTTSAADKIAAKANQPVAPVEPPVEPEPAPPLDPSWSVEEWRGRFILIRYEAVPDSPVHRRIIYGPGKFGAQATVFEDEARAQACADKLNKELEA